MRRSQPPTVTAALAALVLLAVVAAPALASLAPLAPRDPARPALGQPGPSGPSNPDATLPTNTPTPGCAVRLDKRASPLTVTLGSAVDLTLTARFSCTYQIPWLHVVLVVEGSSAMSGDPLQQAREDAAELVAAVAPAGHPAAHVAVVSFNHVDRVLAPLTRDEARLEAAIRKIGASGGSDAVRGIARAQSMLLDGRRQRQTNDVVEVVVLLSRGRDDGGCARVQAASRAARERGVLVCSVCEGSDCDEACVRQLASSPRCYARSGNVGAIGQLIGSIPENRLLCGIEGPCRLTITDTLGSDVTLVSGSARPTPSASDPNGRWLRWDETYVPRGGVTFSLQVRPTRLGRVSTNDRAIAWFQDYTRRIATAEFPVPEVVVIEASPTPTASPTPPRVATPTRTVRPPGPTASPTPRPPAALLPWAGRGP